MTERHARIIDYLLEQHDRQRPGCHGIICEDRPQQMPDDPTYYEVVAKCIRCGLSWSRPVSVTEARRIGIVE